jgi:hypothetical protein
MNCLVTFYLFVSPLAESRIEPFPRARVSGKKQTLDSRQVEKGFHVRKTIRCCDNNGR